jgi:hypothetical protein
MAQVNLQTLKVDQVVAGTWTTASAVDTVPTGLAKVIGVVATTGHPGLACCQAVQLCLVLAFTAG